MNYNGLYDNIKSLECQHIKFALKPNCEIEIDGWVGSHIRNSLLYYAEKIKIGAKSLREILSEIPIDTTHPLYNELKGGCPRGYSIRCHSYLDERTKLQLTHDNPIQFTIAMVGTVCKYAVEIIEAVKLLSKEGFRGIQNSSFSLQILSLNSYNLKDFVKSSRDCDEVTIHYQSPTMLYKTKSKSTNGSYQDKLNGFPSLYQMTLSVANRVAKMATLYGEVAWNESLINNICSMVDTTTSAELSSARLEHKWLESPIRSVTNDRMNYNGVIGNVKWKITDASILPLLIFCSLISIGDNTVYGMGAFDVEY